MTKNDITTYVLLDPNICANLSDIKNFFST